MVLLIWCSYDEVLRFKSSAAHAAAKNREKLGISSTGGGLIQAVADNFDANISSANGLESTHALAILLTQPQPEEHINQQDSSTIKRLKKVKMSENILPDIPIHEYEGPKKPIFIYPAVCHRQNLDNPYLCYVFRTPLLPPPPWPIHSWFRRPKQSDLSLTSTLQSVNRWRHNEYSCCSHPSFSYPLYTHLLSRSDW